MDQSSAAKKDDAMVSAPKQKYKKKRQFCTKCPCNYSKREYLQKHMKNEHNIELEKQRPGRQPLLPKSAICPNDPRPYKCDQCVKEYKKSKHLARHKRTHLDQYCDKCNDRISNYVDHMLKVHEITLPRPFECAECKKCYRTKANIRAHMRIHRAENRIYNCTVCPKSFFFSTDLRKHMKSHSQNRSVICDICGNAFKSADTLKSHMRRHTGEKPYKCSQCPRAFSTSNSLDIHFRTHTGEKPFKCEFCQKGFSDSSTLIVHKRLHTNDNPYQCHLCNRRTKQASNLRSHYKHFHRNHDITGRQIRLNSRILNRFSQADIESHLKQYGDLMVLLEKGLAEHNQEENEKNTQIEKALQIINQFVPKNASVEEPAKDFKSEPELDFDSDFDDETQPIKSIIFESDDVMSKIEMDLLKQEYPKKTIETGPTKCENQLEEIKLEDAISQTPNLIESIFIEDQLTNENDIKYEQTSEDECQSNNNYDDDDNDVDYFPEFPRKEQNKAENSKQNEKVQKAPPRRISRSESMARKAKTSAELSQREKQHQLKQQRRCKECARSFHDIRKHTVEVHSAIERPFECYVCRKVYKRFEHLRYHMRTHGDERNYVCHFCAEAFFLNSDLRKHIVNRHQTNRPFECDNCGKCFKQRHALTIHKRTHSGMKPFVCAVCSDAFASLGSLRIHERRHSGQKPYVCKHCKKAFADSSTHRQHVRIHTGDKPYCCHLCGRRTAQAGNLKSHYRHFHKMIVKHVSMFAEDLASNGEPLIESTNISFAQTSRIEE